MKASQLPAALMRRRDTGSPPSAAHARMHLFTADCGCIAPPAGVVLAWYNGTGPHYDGSKLAIKIEPSAADYPNSRRSAVGLLLAMDASGTWGYVCQDDGNTQLDGMALCRTLGWRGESSLTLQDSGAPNVTVAWSRLGCPAENATLAECSHQDANWAAW